LRYAILQFVGYQQSILSLHWVDNLDADKILVWETFYKEIRTIVYHLCASNLLRSPVITCWYIVYVGVPFSLGTYFLSPGLALVRSFHREGISERLFTLKVILPPPFHVF
jgi:hypothetical protein